MATSFKDTADRSWDLSLTFTTAKRVKSLTGVDLLNITPELFSGFATDPAKYVDVIYAIVKPQADAAGVGDEEFGSALDGDCIYNAIQAYREAVVNFTPSPAQRRVLQYGLEQLMALEDQAEATMKKLVDMRLKQTKAELEEMTE